MRKHQLASLVWGPGVLGKQLILTVSLLYPVQVEPVEALCFEPPQRHCGENVMVREDASLRQIKEPVGRRSFRVLFWSGSCDR